MALDGSESPLQAGGPERKVLPLRWAGLGRWGGSDCDPPGLAEEGFANRLGCSGLFPFLEK